MCWFDTLDIPVIGLREMMTTVRTGSQLDVPAKSSIPRFEFMANIQVAITIKYSLN